MVHEMFAVWDSKAEEYMNPFVASTKGLAIRSFIGYATEKDSVVGKYPADFSLFHLGSFDTVTGVFKCLNAPLNLGSAKDFSTTQGVGREGGKA